MENLCEDVGGGGDGEGAKCSQSKLVK